MSPGNNRGEIQRVLGRRPLGQLPFDRLEGHQAAIIGEVVVDGGVGDKTRTQGAVSPSPGPGPAVR